MKKNICAIFMCIVLLLTNLYSPVFAKENDDTQNADRLFTQAEVSDYRAYGTYPTKSGHVFAGWYEDSSHETPVTGNTPSNGAYAKFVSEEVLTLRFQLRSGTTRQSATTDLRAITSVDSLLYQKVGFELQVDNNVHEITSNTVYSTMASYSDENQQKYQASDVFDETDSKYFVTKVLTGVKNTSFEKEISFTPFWVTMDGTKVSGEERTIQVLDGVQFGANPLGFIAASTDPTHSKVERVTKDGEEVIKADYRKVIFEGIQTLETANTSINPEFHAAGYTHVQFDMYIEKAGEDGISFNTSLQNIQTDGKGQDWKDIVVEGVGTQGDFVRTYKNGVRMPIREGAWYTVSMRVDSHSTDVSLVSYNSKHTIAYLKNLTFTNSFPEEVPFTANPLGFEAGVYTTVETTTKDGEEVIKVNGRKVLFEDVMDGNGVKGDFFHSEYQYVTFDMYIESLGANGIALNTSQVYAYADGQGSDWNGEDNKGEYVRTYRNGVRTPVNTGAWYTVSMKVESHSIDVSLVSPGIPSVIYLKNLSFTNEFAEFGSEFGFIAGTNTTLTQVVKDGEKVARVDGKWVYFQNVMTANGEKGTFFSDGYKYVTFDMYIESVENAFLFNTSNLNIWTNGAGYDWSVNGNQGNYLRSYQDGLRTPINKGAWYTVSMKVESYSSDVCIVSQGGVATIYLKNLTFANEFPEVVSGFVAGEGTGLTIVTMDGEEAVKAQLTASGKRVYFKDVITASGEKGTFFDDGYKYVAFDMYIESVGNSFLFNTSGFNIWTNGQGYDWRNNLAGNGKQGDYLRSYLDGVSVPLNIGAWYTVYMKVESFSSEANITAYQGAATIYLKNLTFANDFPEEAKFTAKPLGFVAGTTDTTITNVIKDGEEAIKVEGRKVCFQDVLAPSGEKGQFFYAGYRYVTFDLYIESVTQNFLFNTSGMNIFTTGAGYDWSVNGSQGNYLRAYQNGLRTVLNKGAWYTVSMRVESNSSDVSIASQNGVATIYLKNLTFANDFPEEVRFTAKPLGFVAGTTDTTLTQVTKDGEEAIKVEGRKVCFQDVMTASGVKGKFFSDGCQYITFDMYIESVAQSFLFNTSQMSIWTNGAGYDWSVNGSQGDYLRTYQNGVYKPINKTGWYTVSMKVESNSTDVSIASQNGTAVFYLKNLTFYQGAQAPSTYLTISDAINYQTYYFDSVNGDDANNGLFANAPKKSVAEANRIISSCTQETPTKILFKAGSRYTETLKVVSFRAKKESPLLIGVYGQTPENQYATFSASPYCVEVSGSNVRVSGLELTCPTANRGFYVYTSEAGAMSNVVLKNNYLHDINFLWDDLTEGNRPEEVDFDTVDPEDVCSNARYTYQNSAIYFTASTSSTQGASWFENVWIEQNEIERVARAGIFINSDWVRRPGINWGHNNYLDDQTGWYPHKNFNVLNNDISYVGGDAIVVIAVDGGFIQGNTSYHAQYLGRSGYYSAGIWCHSSKNLVFQYNEAAYTHMANGSGDGQGFDIDIANQNILFQFNYSHHNEGGGILLINAPTYNADGEKYYTDWKNVTIRNNVFADNDRTAFHIQGKVEKLFVENNTIVIPGTNGEQGIIKSNPHVDNTATGKDWVFSNNIFYLRNKRTSKFEIDFCPNAEFSNNIFYNFEDNFLTNKVKNYSDCYTFNPQISVTEAMPGIDNMVQFSPSESGCFTSGGVLGMLLTSDYVGNFAVGKRYIGAFCE